METPELRDSSLAGCTAHIVSGYVRRNLVPPDQMPVLIGSVYTALRGLGQPEAPLINTTPAVPIRKSVTPDFLICLEDGKKLKMLKRHLRSNYHMTPDEYRRKWGLPSDYPMTARNYASQRSNLAKQIGLGTRGRGAAPALTATEKVTPDTAPVAASPAAVPAAAAPASRSRKRTTTRKATARKTTARKTAPAASTKRKSAPRRRSRPVESAPAAG